MKRSKTRTQPEPLLFIIFMDHILKQGKRRMGKIRIGYWNIWPVYIQGFMYTDDSNSGKWRGTI